MPENQMVELSESQKAVVDVLAMNIVNMAVQLSSLMAIEAMKQAMQSKCAAAESLEKPGASPGEGTV